MRTCLSMSTAWPSAAVCWVVAACSLMNPRLQKIQGREQEDPDKIHEMPEESRVLHPVGEPHRVRLVELRSGAQEIGVHRHAADHVQHVQACEGEISGEEDVSPGTHAV